MDNEDVFQYLNSQDEQAYLRGIGYSFDILEAMWIIWRCLGLAIADRHATWEELIASFPDITIEGRFNVRERESAHGFISDVMVAECRLLEAFFSRDDGDVTYCLLSQDCDCKADNLYAHLDEAIAGIPDAMGEDDRSIAVVKKWLHGDRASITVLYDRGFRAISISSRGGFFETEQNLLDEMEGFAYDIPVPFVRGDVVRCATDGWLGHCRGTFTGPTGPFVLTRLATEAHHHERLLRHGDSSDMTARGLWQDENGRFYRETMHSYIDLEYWREEPKGLRRALPALGMFMQGKIEPEFFFDVYDTILAQERASNLGDHLGREYVKDALQALCMI